MTLRDRELKRSRSKKVRQCVRTIRSHVWAVRPGTRIHLQCYSDLLLIMASMETSAESYFLYFWPYFNCIITFQIHSPRWSAGQHYSYQISMTDKWSAASRRENRGKFKKCGSSPPIYKIYSNPPSQQLFKTCLHSVFATSVYMSFCSCCIRVTRARQ